MALETSPADDSSNPFTGVSWSCVLCSAWFAAFFVYFSYIPLWHTDIWGHVAYGQWMLDHGRLPEVDPFVELAQSTPVIATAWLSQLLFGILERTGGPERLSVAYAVISVSIYLMVGMLHQLRTKRAALAVCCSILTWLIGWDRHLVIRPELLGLLFFVTLLTLLASARSNGFDQLAATSSPTERSNWHRWIIRGTVAVLFGIWANVHGSFAVGLVTLGILAAAAFAENFLKQRSFFRGLHQEQTREPILLLLIAFVATLVNPYGIWLPIYVVGFGAHPNMASISEWQPPGLLSVTGVAVAASTTIFLLTLPIRKQRPPISEWLLLVVFTVAVCSRERMVTWYAPIAVLLLAPGLSGLWSKMDARRKVQHLQSLLNQRSRIQLALVLLFVWLAFSFSPISRPILGGRQRPVEQLFRDQTPLGITLHLRKTTPEGPIANPQWWGDWLVWAGPADLRVMMTTNSLHLVPARHFGNYTAICWAHEGLEKRLTEYGIQRIVVDTSIQKELAQFIKQSPDWHIEYQDSQGIVAARRNSD